MRTLKIYPTSINERFIADIVDALRDGELIIYPTDSRYAIGCDALNVRAIERVCRLKDIDPRRHPLSILCSGISQASRYARIDNINFQLIRSLTPGPYTFILPALILHITDSTSFRTGLIIKTGRYRPACLRSASSSAGGSRLPRRSARLKIPKQALALK